MSDLTQKILDSIDYKKIAEVRRSNFSYLHNSLRSINLLKFDLEESHVPMVYPFYSDNLELRKKLIENKIFTALYWPNVLNWVNETTIEYKYSTHIVHLPIDQRLEKKELDNIIKNILS